MTRLPPSRDLCFIADRPTFGAERLLSVLPAVLAVVGPRAWVIDRGDDDARVRLAYLARLNTMCREHGALLLVSTRVDLALAASAHGVHLPERGLSANQVRSTWPELLVGRSCHDRAGLVAAEHEDADYALLSPVAAPTAKASTAEVLGLAGFSARVASLSLPVLALGGVVPALAARLRSVGAAGVATLGDVLGSADPRARAAELARAWDAGAG